eukprot:tig00021586_g22673.t1
MAKTALHRSDGMRRIEDKAKVDKLAEVEAQAIANAYYINKFRDMEQEIDEEYEEGFRAWLMGQSAFGQPTKAVGAGACDVDGKNLTMLPGVREFCISKEDQVTEFLKRKKRLETIGPMNLDDAYYYYKYIVNGEHFKPKSIYVHARDPDGPVDYAEKNTSKPFAQADPPGENDEGPGPDESRQKDDRAALRRMEANLARLTKILREEREQRARLTDRDNEDVFNNVKDSLENNNNSAEALIQAALPGKRPVERPAIRRPGGGDGGGGEGPSAAIPAPAPAPPPASPDVPPMPPGPPMIVDTPFGVAAAPAPSPRLETPEALAAAAPPAPPPPAPAPFAFAPPLANPPVLLNPSVDGLLQAMEVSSPAAGVAAPLAQAARAISSAGRALAVAARIQEAGNAAQLPPAASLGDDMETDPDVAAALAAPASEAEPMEITDSLAQRARERQLDQLMRVDDLYNEAIRINGARYSATSQTDELVRGAAEILKRKEMLLKRSPAQLAAMPNSMILAFLQPN